MTTVHMQAEAEYIWKVYKLNIVQNKVVKQ